MQCFYAFLVAFRSFFNHSSFFIFPFMLMESIHRVSHGHVVLMGCMNISSFLARILLRVGVERCSIVAQNDVEFTATSEIKQRITVLDTSSFTSHTPNSIDILIDTSTSWEEKLLVWNEALKKNSVILNCINFRSDLDQKDPFLYCMGNVRQFVTEKSVDETLSMLHESQDCGTINYENIQCINAIPLQDTNSIITKFKTPTFAHFITGITSRYLRLKKQYPNISLANAVYKRSFCTNTTFPHLTPMKQLSDQVNQEGAAVNEEEESCCKYCHIPQNRSRHTPEQITSRENSLLDHAFRSLYSSYPPYSSSYPLIDAHCHIQLGILATSQRSIETIELAKRSYHVQTIVTCGVAPGDDWQRIESLSAQYPDCIVPNYGVHPWYISHLYSYESDVNASQPSAHAEEVNAIDISSVQSHWYAELETRLQQNASAGVGECGVDKNVGKHTTSSEDIPELTLETQIAIFEAHIQLACTYHRNLTIHGVSGCWGHIFQSLQKVIPISMQRQSKRKQSKQKQEYEVVDEERKQRPKHIILHSCQSMPLDMMKMFQATFHDVYFSISATAVNSDKMKAVAIAIPLEKLLLESDSPDQLPKALLKSDQRFSHNEPSIMLYTYHTIAEIRKIPVEELIRNVYRNCQRVFAIL
jgi:TatD DNase family protein